MVNQDEANGSWAVRSASRRFRAGAVVITAPPWVGIYAG